MAEHITASKQKPVNLRFKNFLKLRCGETLLLVNRATGRIHGPQLIKRRSGNYTGQCIPTAIKLHCTFLASQLRLKELQSRLVYANKRIN
jgi:hypothetical protein